MAQLKDLNSTSQGESMHIYHLNVKVSYAYLGGKACCLWIAMIMVASKLNVPAASGPCFLGVSVEMCMHLLYVVLFV